MLWVNYWTSAIKSNVSGLKFLGLVTFEDLFPADCRERVRRSRVCGCSPGPGTACQPRENQPATGGTNTAAQTTLVIFFFPPPTFLWVLEKNLPFGSFVEVGGSWSVYVQKSSATFSLRTKQTKKKLPQNLTHLMLDTWKQEGNYLIDVNEWCLLIGDFKKNLTKLC